MYLKIAEGESELIVLEVALADHERGRVDPPGDRARRDRDDLKEPEDHARGQARLLPGQFRMEADIEEGHDQGDDVRRRHQEKVDGQALQVLLDERLLDLGDDAAGLLAAEHAVAFAGRDHVPEPFLSLLGPEIEPDGLDEHGPQPGLEISLVGEEAVETGREER